VGAVGVPPLSPSPGVSHPPGRANSTIIITAVSLHAVDTRKREKVAVAAAQVVVVVVIVYLGPNNRGRVPPKTLVFSRFLVPSRGHSIVQFFFFASPIFRPWL
jgi:hypothetical protein